MPSIAAALGLITALIANVELVPAIVAARTRMTALTTLTPPVAAQVADRETPPTAVADIEPMPAIVEARG